MIRYLSINMKSIHGKGHQLLAMFDIEYHVFSKEITDELMANPEKMFKLSVEKSTRKKSDVQWN